MNSSTSATAAANVLSETRSVFSVTAPQTGHLETNLLCLIQAFYESLCNPDQGRAVSATLTFAAEVFSKKAKQRDAERSVIGQGSISSAGLGAGQWPRQPNSAAGYGLGTAAEAQAQFSGTIKSPIQQYRENIPKTP